MKGRSIFASSRSKKKVFAVYKVIDTHGRDVSGSVIIKGIYNFFEDAIKKGVLFNQIFDIFRFGFHVSVLICGQVDTDDQLGTAVVYRDGLVEFNGQFGIGRISDYILDSNR